MKKRVDDVAVPNDLAACQALLKEKIYLIETHQQTITELEEQRRADVQEKEELKLQINELLQRAFGRRSERYIGDPNQLALDFGPDAADAAEGLAEAVAEAGLQVQEHTRRKTKKPRNEQLPDHLPRYEVEAKVSDDLKLCSQHGPRKLIGFHLVETLEFERPQLKVRVTKYPKYACEDAPECGVASPERPTGLVEGDRYDVSIAAEIIANKYGYHLPVYRQQDIFAGSGWTPGRSTLLNVLSASAFVLEPLIEDIRRAVLADDLLGTDDTTVTLIVPKAIPQPVPGDVKSIRAHEQLCEASQKGRPSVKARMWAYRSMAVPLVFFDFTVTRQRAGPDLVLKDFRGKIMADCYSAYQGIEVRSDGQIQRGACLAHARRKVHEARQGYPNESDIVLAKFRQLYDVETLGATMSSEERQALRVRVAAPTWESLRDWLDGEQARAILPASGLGKALGYLRNHWEALRLYLSDGRMPIDNNEVEQLMKQVAIGRKNWRAPEVPSRTSGRREARDALWVMFAGTLAV